MNHLFAQSLMFSSIAMYHIPQSSSITEASPSDCLLSYPGYSLGEFYPSAEMQSMYSTTTADWAMQTRILDITEFNVIPRTSILGGVLASYK